jgi:hypothetical protein
MKNLKLSWGLVAVLMLICMAFMADSCSNQTTASVNNANAAQNKWGVSPNITNYYEYLQLKQIYEQRDNPNLVMNAYLQAFDGSLRCLGKVKGYGVPYGTQWSQPANGTQGSVPEPNGLYPSTSTNADWIQLIDPATGKAYTTFAEPNLIITPLTLPCKPLNQ